jgi:hypothetical protein
MVEEYERRQSLDVVQMRPYLGKDIGERLKSETECLSRPDLRLSVASSYSASVDHVYSKASLLSAKLFR